MANRRRTNRGGGKGGLGSKIVWAFFILFVVFAWFKTPVPMATSSDIWSFAQAKSKSVQSWVQSFTQDGFSLPKFFSGTPVSGGGTGNSSNGSNGSNGGSSTGGSNAKPISPSDTKAALAGLNTLTIANADKVSYNRDEWKQWSSQPGHACWDTREAALYRDAKPGTVVILDANKKETTDVNKACSIKSGDWIDPYSNKEITNPSGLDIDHVIPLSYVAQHGGQVWDKKKKEKYANDLSDPHHLLAVSASENRSKGDKGPSAYQPKVGQCSYAVYWVNVAKTWNISITSADKSALEKMLGTC